jgi:carbonic anhydrase/acetyltransferase-like protein (isoleucine patch superfamily)
MPKIAPDAFIAPGAVIIGDVEIGSESNIWFGCVIRGDVNYIRIGDRTNIQDNSLVHVTRETGPTIIGSNVTVGHMATLHACTLKDESFVGMGTVVMDHAEVAKHAMLAAGGVLTPKKRIPPGEVWAGNPAAHFRELRPAEISFIPQSAQNYVELSREYMEALD